MPTDTQKRIGILRGGAGRHYESSLKKGGDIISYIHENLADKYKPLDILIDKDHIWHFNGVPVNPGDLVHKVDLTWNLSHPSFSNILESLSIPNLGSGSFLGALLGNRETFKKYVKDIEVHIPRHILSPKSAREVFEKISPPWIVNNKLIKTFPELVDSIEDGVLHGQSIVVEEFISGTPSCAHSIANFRDEAVYVLPPDNLSTIDKEKIIIITKILHKHLNVKHYLKLDFTLNPKRGVFLTSVEFVPDLRIGSHLEKSCESVGAKMHHIVEHILESTLSMTHHQI